MNKLNRINRAIADLAAALQFVDECRLPQNIAKANETGALEQAEDMLEQTARRLVKTIEALNHD